MLFKSKTQIQKRSRWWDRECESLKKKKYCKLKEFKSTNTLDDLNEYKKVRNEFKNYCKQKQSNWKESRDKGDEH